MRSQKLRKKLAWGGICEGRREREKEEKRKKGWSGHQYRMKGKKEKVFGSFAYIGRG